MNEGHIVNDEDARLFDAGQVFARPFWAHFAVAASVEGPRAAEGAVPRTAAREFNRGARIERTDEVALAAGDQVSRREHIVEASDQLWRRPVAVGRDDAGQAFQRSCAPFHGFEKAGDN